MKKTFLYLTAILLLSGLLSYYSLYDGHSWGGDFSLYINQAKSLVDGNIDDLLRNNTFTLNNSIVSSGMGPNLYPWGSPLLLSLIYYFFGFNLLAMKLYGLFFFLLSLIAILLLFKNKLDNVSLLLMVAVFAFNPVLIIFNNYILSEIPYLFFSLFSIFLIDKFSIERKFWVNKPFSLSLTGFCIFLAYFMRTIGIVLIPTLLFCQFIENRKPLKQSFKAYIKENKFDLLPHVTFFVLFFLSKKVLPDGSSLYLSMFSNASIKQISGNIIYYIKLPAIFFGEVYIPSIIIYIITIPFVVYGIIKSFKKSYIYLVYIVCTVSILIIWPFQEGIRFIFPLLPFYIYFLFIGLLNISISFPSIIRHPEKNFIVKQNKFCIVFSLCLISYFLIQTLLTAYPNFKNKRMIDGPFLPESAEMFSYVINNTNINDSIIFFKPRVLTLLTNRRSYATSDFSHIRNGKGDYLVLHKRMGSYYQISPSDSFLQKYKNIFKLSFENKDFIVYRIIK